MAGMNRDTGQLLDGWSHVVQSIMLIITTGYGERTLRRWFGPAIPHLLGENLTVPTVVRFFAALIAALEVRVHLIPRRNRDVERARGGVRGVIPEKHDY